MVGLKRFVDNPVTTVDIGEADIRVDIRKKLPFKDGSFDVVVNMDVLEHIEAGKRKGVVGELVRVARNKVIISVPFGSRAHMVAERRLVSWLRSQGKSVSFLEEHVKYGLPVPEKIFGELKYPLKVLYSGDFRVSNFLFRLHLWEAGWGPVDRLAYWGRKGVNGLFNLLVYPFWFYEKPRETTNRFYVVVEKKER